LAFSVSANLEAHLMLAPTLDLEEAARRPRDVVVVGAGPAGALAAHQLAQWGVTVLLVDQAAFPRWKVCGCCLNRQALDTLRTTGLGHLPAQLGAVRLDRFLLASRGCRAQLSLAGGMALSREAFDAALVGAAIARGSAFLPQTQACLGQVGPATRTVVLRQGEQTGAVSARLVLAAGGLGSRLLHDGVRPTIVTEHGSWIGAGAIASAAPDFYTPQTIFMACGPGGYVGLVRLEDSRLDLAAAFDPAVVKRFRHPGEAAAQILQEAGFPAVQELPHLPWRGTPALTRHARWVARERLFVLGDAAGYLQPFTGEGIAWALAAAEAIAPLAVRGVKHWQPELMEEWTGLYRRIVTCQQQTCRAMMMILRHPGLTRAAIRVLAHFPALARPVLRRLHQSSASRGVRK
jgi:flavin-dependent dehydrogenase